MAKLGTSADSAAPTGLAVRSSRDTVGENIAILLIGAPGGGKTVCSVTISELCPDTLPAETMTELSDTLVIEFDRGGLDSLFGLNLSVPHIDLSTVPEAELPSKGLEALDIARQRVESGETKNVIIDGLTSQNHTLMNLFSKQKKLNKWDLMMNTNLAFFQKARALPANVVFITHGKVVSVMSGMDPAAEEVARAKLSAKGLDDGDVNVNIPGQSGEFYVNNSSLICPVTAEGPKNKKKFFIHPRGTKRFISKCRFPQLPDKMPASLSEVVRILKEAGNG